MPIITLYDSVKDPNPFQAVDLSFDDLCDLFDHRWYFGKKEDAPGWAPHKLKPGTTRKAENVESVSYAVFDLDHKNKNEPITEEDFLKIVASLEGYAFYAYTSHSHTPQSVRIRLIFPLDRDCLVSEWPIVRRGILGRFLHLSNFVDQATADVSRFWYVPSAPSRDVEHDTLKKEGKALEVANFLRQTEFRKEIDAEPIAYKPATPELLERARKLLAEHGPAIQGQGGDAHTFQVGAILFNDCALDWEEAWPLVQEWNKTCVPPWNEDELTKKLENGALYSSGEEGKIRVEETFKEKTKELVSQKMGDSTAPKDSFEFHLHQAQKDLEEWYNGKKPNSPQQTFKLAPDLLTAKFPPIPWLVRGILPEKSIVAISGEPKTAKTWVGVELAIAVATGAQAFNEFPAPAPRGVAMFLAEDDEQSVRNRLRALCYQQPEKKAGLCRLGVQCRGFMDLVIDEHLCRLIANCRMLPTPPALLVLDPLRDLHSGKEKESDDMSEVMHRLRALRDILGCSIVFVHHSSKTTKETLQRREGQKMRGSSAIHGAVDGGFYMALEDENECRWVNRVRTELKAARSAGSFALTLSVEDNPDGQAKSAKWTHEKRKTPTSTDAQERILEVIKKVHPDRITSNKVYEIVGGRRDKVLTELRALAAAHKIHQEFQDQRHIGWTWIPENQN